MSTINSGLGWSCDSNFYAYAADTLIGTNRFGDDAYKTYDGGAIVASINVSSVGDFWAIISTVENYTAIYQASYGEPVRSFLIDSVRWYIVASVYGYDGQPSSYPYANPNDAIENPSTDADYENIVELMLTAANMQSTVTNIPTVNYVKEFVEGVEAETATRVNANKTNIGTLSSLTTTTKTDTVSAINEINSVKQPKTMSVEITVDGTPQTTVENAIGAINSFTSAKISDIYANLGIYGNDVYGLQVDYQNYIYTRLCGAVGKTAGTDFNTIAPWSGIKRCNLADDGTVNAYYGDNNYIEDGSNGQCMVEIPKFYYRVVPLKTEPIGDSVGGKHLRKANYYISATKYEGFKTHPLFVKSDGAERDKAYISAYEASIYDVSESVYILDDAQVADFTASTGDKLSSIANAKPCSGASQKLTRMNAELLAVNRGTGWHGFDIKVASAVQMLFMVEYGMLNSQTAIGKGVVDKTGVSSNDSELTGQTSSLGNSSGMANGTNGLVSVSYRGVENFYGNIWRIIEGINLWGDGTLRGGQPYICNDYTFTENTKTGYTAAKFTVTSTRGYISAFGYDLDFDWLFLPSECVNANSNYPVGDYSYSASDLNDYRIPFHGAPWDSGMLAGAFCWNLNNITETHYRSIGVRLMYVS